MEEIHNLKTLTIDIIMLESTEKIIKISIHNLRVFLRPHIFLLLNHFFVEGMPKYTNEDMDKPNNFIDDPDNASPIKFNLNLHRSLFCLDDEIDVIGCSSNLVISFE
jgi:hypothetical protein